MAVHFTPLSRAVGSTAAFGALVAIAGHAAGVGDPAAPLVVIVAWWARRRGRAAGMAAAATGAVVAISTAVFTSGDSTRTLLARVVVVIVALPLVAWIVGAKSTARGGAGHPDEDVPSSVGGTDDSRRFRAMADALPQLAWTATAAGRLDYINGAGLDYIGLTLAPALGGGFRGAVEGDDLPGCMDRWTEAVRSGAPFDMEYRIRRSSDGEARWHLGRARPVHAADGSIEKWIGTCADIHDQRHAADAIRRWELMFTHSSWGVLLLDEHGATITAANPAFERMHGRPDGGMQRMSLADLVAPEARAHHDTHLSRVERDGRVVFETMHVRGDGTRFPVLVDMTRVPDADGTRYCMANYLDLTLVRAADAARETAEVRFRAVQDVSPDAFMLWDIEPGPDGIRDGVLRYANPAASRLLHRDLHEVLGRRLLELFPDLYGTARFALYERVYRTGRTEELTTFHEGFDLWLRLVVVKIGDGIGVIATDVTAYKQMEAVMLRTRDELEQLVTERTRELHHARDLAVQANRAKSDFLSRASHELRTPLSSVIGFSNILLKNKQGSLAPDELTYLSRIARNGRNLLALVNDLLDLSKIEAGRVDLELSPVSLFDVLYEVQDTLEPRAAELGLALRVEVEQENDLVIADETRLRQVLVNLAGNAIKYTRTGGVVIRVVSNDASAPLRIDVVDTGPGIPADRLDAIFHPFVVDATPAAGDAATGLGLAITRALCDLMGYRLTVDSRVGHGSTFSVHLLAGDLALAPARTLLAPI